MRWSCHLQHGPVSPAKAAPPPFSSVRRETSRFTVVDSVPRTGSSFSVACSRLSGDESVIPGVSILFVLSLPNMTILLKLSKPQRGNFET